MIFMFKIVVQYIQKLGVLYHSERNIKKINTIKVNIYSSYGQLKRTKFNNT